MPALQRQDVVDFSRGLYAYTSRFTRPPGTFPRVSNFVYTPRGALQTCDGSLIQSSLNGTGPTSGQYPFRYLVRFAPSTGSPKLYAFQLTPGGVALIDVTGLSWSGNAALMTSQYATPNAVQIADKLAIALGRNYPPKLWDGSSLSSFTNSWSAALPTWQASTAYATGIAIQSGGNVFVAKEGGTSGTVAPTFPPGYQQTVADGSVLWENVGGSGPPALPGADFFFFHGGFLWAWGTDANYTNNPNLTGPDGLWMSDLNNPGSWNPLNAIFVGKGDGETPMGGAVFTLGEAGIAATPQLVLFKNTKTYVLTGYLPNATLAPVPTGLGCVAPGSIQFFAEIGIMRLCYRGIAVFDAQNDTSEQFTDPIRAYLFGGTGIQPVDWGNIGLSMSFQTDNPRCYVVLCPLNGSGGTLTRAFGFDLTNKAWFVLDLPFQVSTAAYIPNLASPCLVAGANDGTIRRVFQGDQTWDGSAIVASVRTPDFGRPAAPIFVRRAVVFATPSVAGNGASALAPTLNYVDADGSVNQEAQPTPPQVAENVEIAEKFLTANLDLSFSGQVLLEAVEWQWSPEAPQPMEPTSNVAEVVTVVYQSSGSQSVGANATSVQVTLPGAGAPSANYVLAITPNWNTTFWVAQKTATSFTVEFNTPAPADGSGSIDWSAEITQ